jgi:threonylcarbamoyladenosine tRNA methylthiotransferase MtaB
MKYAIVTFGCRVNQADSLALDEELLARGGEPASPELADVVVVNTCSVTATADQGARQTIRRIARLNPSARVIATGCYATRRAEEVRALPGVVRIVGNTEKERLAELVGAEAGLTTAERFAEGDGACGASIRPGVGGRTAYTLRVQTGCEEHCAYCIIPSTRGVSRSVPLAHVLAHIARIEAAGFREIALTGVHLGAYGRDLTPASSLAELLQRAAGRHGGVMLRVSSLEPMDCPPELVDLAADGAVAPHFHLPLQHASDRVLARMRRPYTRAEYDGLVSRIRLRLPDASIGSDIIIGFPGETDSDFETMLSYLADSPLTHLHVFPYSDRPGTAAAAMSEKVDPVKVKARARLVREAGHALTERFRAAQVGAVRPGLTIEDGSLVVTDNYLKVRVAPGLPRNERVRVRIVSAGEPMRGEVVSPRSCRSSPPVSVRANGVPPPR